MLFCVVESRHTRRDPDGRVTFDPVPADHIVRGCWLQINPVHVSHHGIAFDSIAAGGPFQRDSKVNCVHHAITVPTGQVSVNPIVIAIGETDPSAGRHRASVANTEKSFQFAPVGCSELYAAQAVAA